MNPRESSPFPSTGSWWRGIIVALDRNGAITHLNEKGATILGCSFADVEGKLWIDTFIKESERDQVRSVFNDIMDGNPAPFSAVEGEVITCTGTVRSIRWYNTLLKSADGRITGIMSYGEDITKEKEVQDSLQKMQQFQESVIANANIWIAVLEPDSTILVWNEAAEAISGYKKGEVIGKKTVWKQLYPDKDYRRKVTGEIKRIIGRDKYLENFETEIHCADGTIKTIVWNTRGLRDAQGDITSFIAIGRDITAQKSAEFRAGESSRFLAAMIDTLPIPVFFKDTEGRYLGCNPPFEEYLGIKREKLAGKTVYDISPKDLADKYAGADQQLFDNPVPQRYETQVQYADGSRHDVIFYKAPFFNKDGTLGGLIGAIIDITERKRSETALRESEERYHAFFTTSRDCIFITTVNGRWEDFNDAAVELFGYESREELLKTDIAQIYANPHERDIHIGHIREKGYSLEYPVDLKKKDGTIINTLITTVVRKNASGNTIGFQGSIRDITEQKRAEEALVKSRFQLAEAMDLAHLANWEVDIMSGIFTFNDPFYAMYGTTAEREGGYQMPVETFLREFIHPDDAGKIADDISRAIQTTDPRFESELEQRIIRRDGAIRHINVQLKITKDAAGRTVKAHGVNQDITERKQMETALRESRQLFADIISFLPDPTFVVDMNGKVLAWNRAIEQLSGIAAKDMIGKGDYEYSLWQYGKRRPILIDLVLHPDQEVVRLDYAEIHDDGRTVTAQTEITLTGSGHPTSLLLVASPLIDAQGKITGAIESIRDISRLKETELELSRINENLEKIVSDRTLALEEEIAQRVQAENDVKDALNYTRSVIEANPDLVAVLDGKGTIMDMNAATESLTGVPRDQMIGTSYLSYLVDDGTLHDSVSRLLEKGMIENKVQVRRNDGHITPLSINSTLIRGNDPADTRIIVAGHDITRQKHDEESIKASLDDKILLLREVHHRVKNNLQIIISLVSLQMRQTDNPEVKQLMSETQNRVRAMSLVHEKLYRSDSLSQIDFADYTRFLATQLFSFYGMDTRRVRLDFAMKKIMMNINTAIPLGLIMNELISNALRHSFLNGREGTISISGGHEGNIITLVVRDNGIGIPRELDWKSTTSLGMQLVTSLVDQVDGIITLDRENGTMFTITVKKASHQEEPDDMHIQASIGQSESSMGGSIK